MALTLPRWSAWFLILAALPAVRGPAVEPAADALARGRAAFERGALAEAVQEWRAAAAAAGRSDPQRQIEALVNLAAVYHWLGRPRLSVEASEQALAIAEADKNPRGLLLAKSSLGLACTCSRQAEWAERNLREALALAEQQNDPAALAATGTNLGNLLANQSKTDDALEALARVAALAEDVRLPLARARALGNAAAIAARAGRTNDATSLNSAALAALAQVAASHEQALLLIRAGQTDAELGNQDRAQASYRQALAAAEQLDDRRAMTWALGYLGGLAEARKDHARAVELTRQAILVAQQVPLPEALYQWEWQSGRLLAAQGDRAGALASYRRAIQTLDPLRADLVLGCGGATGSFRETVGPVYSGLADLLLQQADGQQDDGERAGTLREARAVLERLKSAELEDYFRDECAGVPQVRATAVERLGQGTAVLYVIPLPDRTELLVSVAEDLRRFRVPVGGAELDAVVRQFRVNLENRGTNRYLQQARELRRWLIDPLEKAGAVAGVHTLVVVPSGSLRTIPLAALHDGERFLIEQYAVAVTPGLTLLGPRPMPRQTVTALVAGLSEPVPHYAPLPFAAAEVRQVGDLFGADTLLDKQFVGPELRRELTDNQYEIVHLATHGEFDKDASRSYILTYDGKLTVDELAGLLRPGKFRGKPVELLTLSACQTAAGDDRAALGLAGVAVQAGARSALATLWFVHDQSTALLMGEFYEQLQREPGLSKAQALQRAELKLLNDPRYEHPGYWSPYLIIGNWL